MTSPALLSVRGLSVRYASRVVDDVSFDIPRGETLALVGESGSGKTTIARATLRLIASEAGDIRFDGIDVRALRGEPLRQLRRRMQIVFQDPFSSLDPRMRVGDTVAEGMLVHGVASPADAAGRAVQLLDEVGMLPSDAARLPHELSGGQRQRVAIARALAVGPDLLVLDEAVSALDVTTQARILELFERVRAQRGLTCLFIAHNLAVVQRVASRVAVMYLGRIVELAPAARFFAAPAHPYSRALLAAVPVPDPRARRATARLTGDPGDLAQAGGCPFYGRCPHPAKDQACLAAVPKLAAAGPDHSVACIKEQA